MVRDRRKDPLASNQHYTRSHGRGYIKDGRRRPTCVAPGGASGDRNYLDDSSQGPAIYRAMAKVGYPLISPDGAGHSKLGNQAAQDAIGKGIDRVQADLGTAVDKAILIALSGGAAAALNFARAFPELVAAMLLIVPGVDLSWLYELNSPANHISFDTAYSVTPAGDWINQYAADYDPALNTEELAEQAIPTQIHYAEGFDGAVLDTNIEAFMAQVPHIEGFKYPGESHVTVAGAIDPDVILDFLEPHAFAGSEDNSLYLADDLYLSDDLYLMAA